MLQKITKKSIKSTYVSGFENKIAFWGVRLKQRIRFPLFERLFRRISILRGASRRGGGGCYDTLAERYGERIHCFTLTPFWAYKSGFKWAL
jgi:hypothetical protein